MRRLLKGAAAGVLHYSGLRKALCAVSRRRSGGRRITIVSYHRVVEDYPSERRRSIPGLLISRATFRRHLEEAHAAGYRFASLDEALEVMTGARDAPGDLFVVTFDDGYREVYLHARPVLRSMGVPAIVYLPSGLIGSGSRLDHDRLYHLVRLALRRGLRVPHPLAAELLRRARGGPRARSAALDQLIAEHPSEVLKHLIAILEEPLRAQAELLPSGGELMSWEEVRALAADGVALGAHTVGHTVLPLEPRERIEQELRQSKETIERETGRRVEHFAYCNGWYSEEVVRALIRNGYRSAVTTEDLPNRIGGDPFTLKRKVLWENFSLGMLGDYSPSLTACQLDDVFGFLGVTRPVPGKRAQGEEAHRHR